MHLSLKRPRAGIAAIALCAAVSVLPGQSQATPVSGTEAVRSLYATLLSTMRNGAALGQRGRYATIAPVVRQNFDVDFMAKLAVGPGWASLSEPQRQVLTQAFERYIAAVYAERFDSYAGEKLQVIGEQPSPGGAIVRSQIVKANGEPININYLVRQNGGSWQIADVYLNGTISELATRRAEFGAILKTQGVDGLIATLNRKADLLSAARSS